MDDNIQVIKKEVLDIADLSDKLSGLIISQQKQIELQTESLEVIRDILQGTHDVNAVDQTVNAGHLPGGITEEDYELPLRFSLRRSALYQNYISRRELGKPLVNLRNGYIKEVIKHSQENFDHRKCVKDPYAESAEDSV